MQPCDDHTETETMNRIDRLIAILTTLQSKKFVTADFIADKYEISIRTVYRDLKALGEIGVSVNIDVYTSSFKNWHRELRIIGLIITQTV